MIFIYGIILIFLICAYNWNRRKLLIASWKIPGPFALPIIGNALLLYDSFAVLDIAEKLHRNYSNMCRVWFGSHLFTIFFQPEHVGKILTAHETRDKGQSYSIIKDAIRGDGLISKQDEIGMRTRKLLNPSIQHYTMLNDFYATFNKQWSNFERILGTYVDKGEFDIFQLTLPCLLDMITETTLGAEIKTQDRQNMKLLTGANNMLKIIGLKMLQPWLQIPFIFKLTKWHKIYSEACDYCHNFVNGIVEQHIDSYLKEEHNQNNSSTDSTTNGKKPSLFVDTLINLTLNKKLLPKSDIYTETLTMLLAGFETTAMSTSYIALELALHPHYQEEIYQEIMTILPDKTAPVTYDDIMKLQLGDRFIKETFRIFPTVPATSRSVKSDLKIDDIIIPAGTEVVLPFLIIHRDKKIWGPNADQFNPDNFLPENYDKIPPYSYLPFSAGLRNCIGYKYANIVMRMFLFYLLRNYRLTTNLKMEDLKVTFNITLDLVNKHLVTVHKRT